MKYDVKILFYGSYHLERFFTFAQLDFYCSSQQQQSNNL